MKKLLIGKEIYGNFSCEKNIDNVENAILEKSDDCLFIRINNDRYQMNPVDQEAENLISLFDDHSLEENDSIYDIKKNNDIICVVLYTYKEKLRLTSSDKKMFIYLDRQIENQILSEDEYSHLNIEYKRDIPSFLENEFKYNNSIFISDTKQKDEFIVYGREYNARMKFERTGVFSIKRLSKLRNKFADINYSQIYGQVKFITFEESTEISSSGLSKLSSAKTSEVMEAWNQYMDFEREIFNEQMDASHMFNYKQFKIIGENIVFSIKDEDVEYIESAKEGDYEFIPFFEYSNVDNYPKTFEEIREFRKYNRRKVIFLKKCINEDFDTNKLIFKYNESIDPDWGNYPGVIYISSFSLDIEQRRRKEIMKKIESKNYLSANIIMNLADPNVVDTKTGRTNKAITNNVLYKMFGKIVEIKEKYRRAMEMAINTPDIALIQGPPGSGKTTLIRGLIARINERQSNAKILVSAEQHEALYNAVGQASKNNLIPPFITSVRYNNDSTDEDDSQLEKNVKEFQNSFLKLCDNILREGSGGKTEFSSNISKLVYHFNNIKNSGYSINEIRSNFENITSILMEMGYLSYVEKEHSAIRSYLFKEENKIKTNTDDISIKMLRRKIESQRLTREQYEDDGYYQLESLQERLKKMSLNKLLIDKNLYEKLSSVENENFEDNFNKYIEYVRSLKDQFSMDEVINDFEKEKVDPKEIVDNLYFKIMNISKKHNKSFYDIIEELKFRLYDIDNSIEIVKNYTSVIGSTCAQANRSLDYVSTISDRYDYVIIDEAARANPLDIMIPMMLGTQVILVGDQKQLPHYIENSYLKRFSKKSSRFSNFNEELLTKSFFEILYDNLEKAYDEGRIKYKRTARIEEQHRMNPIIGDFISKEFYDGAIESSERTKNNINNYNVFDNKNIAWVNVPMELGPEQKFEESKIRYAEVERIINILKKLVQNNSDKKLDIGIISFYGGQVALINKTMRENFPDEYFNNDDSNVKIYCDTVDSYQGREFDIVILSGVRSNNEYISTKALGFIDYSDSRINVALSRAKKLLVVVADKNTFIKNKHFSNFIDYIKEKDQYYGQ